MLFTEGNSPFEVASKVLINLYSSGSALDPELIAEDSAVIVIKQNNNLKNWVNIKNGIFDCTDEYKSFSPFVDPKLIEIEKEYWREELFLNGQVDGIVEYLREYPLSKRAIILLWKDQYRNLSDKCSCTTSIFFRRKGDELEVHTSVRANNASFFLFLDSSFIIAVQEYVASKLGLKMGDYVHFINSLHMYKSEKELVEKTYEYLKDKQT